MTTMFGLVEAPLHAARTAKAPARVVMCRTIRIEGLMVLGAGSACRVAPGRMPSMVPPQSAWRETELPRALQNGCNYHSVLLGNQAARGAAIAILESVAYASSLDHEDHGLPQQRRIIPVGGMCERGTFTPFGADCIDQACGSSPAAAIGKGHALESWANMRRCRATRS